MRLPCVWDGSAYTRRLHPISCSVSLSLQPVSVVSMALPPMDEISTLDWVEVFTPDGASQFYRVSSVSTDTETGEKTVSLEHGACTLDDVMIVQPAKARKPVSKKDTIENMLAFILQGQARWTVGTVESTDTIYLELGGLSLMTAALSIMDAIPDYQMYFVQNGADDWHIDILARPTAPVCEGRLSRNLSSCDISYDAGSVCTRVYGDLPDGHMDSTNIAVYGLHEESISLNEGLSTAQKQRIAQAYLSQHDHPSVSISISAVELSQVTGLSIDQFTVGQVCRIVIPWLGVVADEIIVSKRYDDVYNAPEQVSLSLANAVPDLSIAIAAVTGGGGGKGGGGIAGQAKRFATHFDQTDQYFRLLATDTEWDELGNGQLTAYGQIVLTSSSFNAVVSSIGKDGTITAASIALAINKEGSNAIIAADHIDIDGLVTLLEAKAVGVGSLNVEGFADFKKRIYAEDYIYTEESLFAAQYVYGGSGFRIGNNNSYGNKTATWQSKTVVTGVGVTLPSITRSNSRQFVYAVNGDTSNLSVAAGSIITSYNGGSVNPTTETIYYLGYVAS